MTTVLRSGPNLTSSKKSSSISLPNLGFTYSVITMIITAATYIDGAFTMSATSQVFFHRVPRHNCRRQPLTRMHLMPVTLFLSSLCSQFCGKGRGRGRNIACNNNISYGSTLGQQFSKLMMCQIQYS